jgi:SAM-dependent methyltransferase
MNLFRRRKDASPPAPPPAPLANGAVAVLERPTPETFVADNYLLANPDVAALRNAERAARGHFERHGAAEGRLQISRAFLDGREERNRRRFARFEPILLKDGAAGPLRPLAAEGAFPVAFGDTHYESADYQAESSNHGFGPFDAEVDANPDRLYLDVGCGLRRTLAENCLYLEVYPSLTADLVVEPDRPYPIASESMDGVGCFAVLEHVTRPWEVAAELRRILKPGGLLYVDWPFLQPVHGYPSHFYNATRYGLEKMFEDGFEVVDVGTFPHQGPDYTMTWILGELVRSLPEGEVRESLKKRTVAELIASQPGDEFWTRVNECLPEQSRLGLASGNSLVARKK